jgi:hypothetical protein
MFTFCKTKIHQEERERKRKPIIAESTKSKSGQISTACARRPQPPASPPQQSAPVHVPPAEVDQPGEVVRVGAGDDEHMEQLVAVPREVEPPGHPPLGHPGGIHRHAGQVGRAHGHLVPRREHGLRAVPEHEHLVHDGHQARHAHAREQPRARPPQLGPLEDREQGDGHGGGAGGGDEAEVERLEEGVAQEGVVDERVEGGDDEPRDAGVVQAEEHVAGVLRVARQQVARAAHQQAEHGAAQVRVERPPRDAVPRCRQRGGGLGFDGHVAQRLNCCRHGRSVGAVVARHQHHRVAGDVGQAARGRRQVRVRRLVLHWHHRGGAHGEREEDEEADQMPEGNCQENVSSS